MFLFNFEYICLVIRFAIVNTGNQYLHISHFYFSDICFLSKNDFILFRIWLNIKMCYWIISYVFCQCFVSRLNPWFLHQIPVIIRWCFHDPLQMVCFLRQIYRLGLYLWGRSCLAVEGKGCVACAKRVVRI